MGPGVWSLLRWALCNRVSQARNQGVARAGISLEAPDEAQVVVARITFLAHVDLMVPAPSRPAEESPCCSKALIWPVKIQ